MSAKLRTVTTGVASCVLLLPGCRRPSAEIAVSPEEGGPSETQANASRCEDGSAQAARRPKPGSADDSDPPVIIGGRFIARDRIQLSFSEALAPVDQVNPRQFRLSSAYSRIDYQAGYANGYYYDLGGNDTYEPPVVIVALETYADTPEQLGLRLNRPIPVERCIDIRETRANLAGEVHDGGGQARSQIGVFLHYTARGSVGIRDVVNNPMADMGGEWALHFGARSKNMFGTEPVMRIDLLLELDCPDENMGAAGPPGPK